MSVGATLEVGEASGSKPTPGPMGHAQSNAGIAGEAPLGLGPGADDDGERATQGAAGASEDPLIALAQVLESGIDDCLLETRDVLRQWVRDTISKAAGRRLIVEPAARKRRLKKVMRALEFRSNRTAELLLHLTDEPDVFHDYRALAESMALVKDVGSSGEPSASTKNLIRVRLSDLRARLRLVGLDGVIQNQNRRGYMVTAEDALRIQLLWSTANIP